MARDRAPPLALRPLSTFRVEWERPRRAFTVTSDAKILLIDDNVDNLRVATDVLEQHGYEVRVARDGQTGIKRLESAPADLILLDVQMPGIDGYETCRRIQADARLASIPVIFMTSRTDVEDKVRAFESGGVDYVTKPFEARELVARVETQLQVRRLQAELVERNRQLEDMNATLEKRVAEAVEALVKRAEEVERLNEDLRVQVRDRSVELRRALQRLQQHDHGAYPEDEIQEGTVLGDRFEVGRQIGRGGMGVVHHGIDRRSGGNVAIKVIREYGVKAETLQRFLGEAKAAASVEHPGVVRMLDVDVTPTGLLYQVQEYVAGETLATSLNRHGPFDEGVTARLIGEVARTLAACHAAHIVHRDLKPENIMLTIEAPGARVLDFGISKQRLNLEETVLSDEELDEGVPETQTGIVLGTPRYMSPEQRYAANEVGAPADVFALGVVACVVGTGLTPRRRGVERLQRIGSVIQACLQLSPRDRLSAAEMGDQLLALADEMGVPPLPDLVKTDRLGQNAVIGAVVNDGPTRCDD